MRWFNPDGNELWSTTADLTIEQPPASVAELDIPLIMYVDLPLDQPGDYFLGIEVDEEEMAIIRLLVGNAQVPLMPTSGMVS